MDQDRICYECRHCNLCVTRYYFDPFAGLVPRAATANLNLYGSDATPGARTAIMVAVANCCQAFEPSPEESHNE